MSISDRYRELSEEVRFFASTQQKKINENAGDSLKAAVRSLQKADKVLDEQKEGVGEIPRIRLEDQLTPILMKGHNTLDRSRLDFIEAGEELIAKEVWELQQKIYRLLNDL